MDKKDSTKKALERYFQRNLVPAKKRNKRNEKPEKQVEKLILAWCKNNNWSIEVVESKAVYSANAGRYLSGQAKKGFADLVGSTDQGQAVAIELKAPGKLSTIRPDQYLFLMEKIKANNFAVCVDSIEKLEKLWSEYLKATDRKAYLVNNLPVPKIFKKDSNPLFDE